ncbi:MAG: DNA-directed RNA polymerase subunit omega, partial [Nevskiaceae bacterium]
HKSTVLSLREIAEGYVTESVLDEQELPVIQAPKMELEALDPSFDL